MCVQRNLLDEALDMACDPSRDNGKGTLTAAAEDLALPVIAFQPVLLDCRVPLPSINRAEL